MYLSSQFIPFRRLFSCQPPPLADRVIEYNIDRPKDNHEIIIMQIYNGKQKAENFKYLRRASLGRSRGWLGGYCCPLVTARRNRLRITFCNTDPVHLHLLCTKNINPKNKLLHDGPLVVAMLAIFALVRRQSFNLKTTICSAVPQLCGTHADSLISAASTLLVSTFRRSYNGGEGQTGD